MSVNVSERLKCVSFQILFIMICFINFMLFLRSNFLLLGNPVAAISLGGSFAVLLAKTRTSELFLFFTSHVSSKRGRY